MYTRDRNFVNILSLSLLQYFNFLIKICMFICAVTFICIQMPAEPQEINRLPGGTVKGSWEPPNIGAEN